MTVGPPQAGTEVTMRALANRTGGQFFKPSTPQELQQAYIDIAGILRNLAGVNATMQINYQNVEVNSTPISGGLAFDYVPVDNGMTSPDSRTTILWPNNTRSFKNQSSCWTAANNYQLHFDIGTIKLGERWETTYRLKANQTGLIRLFDNTSKIFFNDGAETLEFPDLFITVSPNTTPMGLQSGSLLVKNLALHGDYNKSVIMQWDLNYTGYEPKVTENYYYCYQDVPICTPSTGIAFGHGSISSPSSVGWEIPRSYALDVSKFPPGQYVLIVEAKVPGVSHHAPSGFSKVYTAGKINIWLK